MGTARKRAAPPEHSVSLNLVQDLPSEIPDGHFKAIFDALPSMYLVLTPDFRMVAANLARFQGTWSTPESVIEKNVFEVFPDNPDDPKATGVTNLRASLERVLAYRKPDRMAIQKYDIPRPSPKGDTYDYEERYWRPLNTPVLNESGEVQYIIHQVEDVTDFVRLEKKESETAAFNEQMKREIDERRRIEKLANEEKMKFAESEERFRSTFELASIGIANLDLEGRWIRPNQKLCEILGYSREELVKLTFQELTHPDDLAICLEAVRKLVIGETAAYLSEKRYIRKDGSSVWVDVTVTLSRDPAGKPKHFIATIQDISIRKAALEALSRSEERFQLASRAAQDAIWDWDLETNTVEWNEAGFVFCDSKSINKTDIHFWEDSIFPEDRARVLNGIHHMLDTGGTHWQEEYRFMCADGSFKYVLDRGYVSRNPSGTPVRVIGAMRNITRRKEMEISLMRRKQELKTLADSIPQLAWMADSKGYIFWYNRRWYEYTGTTLKEMKGWGWQKVHHPDHVNRVVALIRKHWKSGDPWEDTFPLKSKKGEWRWFLSRAIPIRDEKGEILRWFGTNTDITEQLQAQEELERQRTELETEREIRERFVATVTHDLRNPLAAAKTSTQLVLRHPEKAELRETLLNRGLKSLERVDQMIQDLLDANRIKAGRKLSIQTSECDLRQVTSETLEELSLVYGNRFDLQSPDKVQGTWSCEGLRRILENLCTNAVKYGSADSPVTVTLKPDNDHVLLSVHNFGPVIPKEQLANLFEPFQRATTGQGKRGWGLGLALVRGLAEAHCGGFGVTSNEEDGTIFTVTLPWHSPIGEEAGINKS